MKPVLFARLLSGLAVVYTIWNLQIIQKAYPFAFVGAVLYLGTIVISSIWFYLFFQVRMQRKRMYAAKLFALFVLIPAVWTIAYMGTMQLGFYGWDHWSTANAAINNGILSLQVGFVNGIVGVRPWLWCKK